MKAHKKNKSREIARNRYWSKHEKQTYRCPDCDRSVDEIKGTFEVHHKNGSAYDNRMQNLIGLCGLCHALREDKKPSKDEIRQLVSSLSSSPDESTDASAAEVLDAAVGYLSEWYETHKQTKNVEWAQESLDISSGWGPTDANPKTEREVLMYHAGAERILRKFRFLADDETDE
jgi:hypothetical protein